MNKQQLKSYRFDPPDGWKCRFSLEELKEIYLKLFGYNWFVLDPHRAMKKLNTYHVGKNSTFGVVRLEDGGMMYLESCTIEELDWYLFIGQSFFPINYTTNWENRLESPIPNLLHDKLDRYEALISLDIDL